MLIGLGKMVKRVAGGFSLLVSRVLGFTTIPGSGGSGYYVTTVGANTNALVMFSDATGWVSYSYDDGKSWELSFQVPNAGISTDAYVVGGKLVIRPRNTGTQEVYVSTDGKTYDIVMVGDYADLGTRIYTVGDYIYISGKQGQTYFSKNGTDWQSVSIETEYSDGNPVYDLAINYTKSRDKEGIYWATTTNSAQIRYYKENLLSDTVVFSDAGYLNGSATLTSKVYYNNGNYYVASSDRKSTYYVSESANFNSSLEWQKSTIQDSNGNSITSFTDDGTLDLYGANFVHQTDEFNKPNSDWYTGGILAWFRTNYQSQGGTYSYEFFVTNDGATWKKVNYSLDLVTGNIKVIQAPSGSYILSAKDTSYWFEIWGWLSNPGSTYLSLSQFSLFDGYLRYDSNLQINFIRTEAEVAAEFVPAGQYVVVDRANGIIWKGRSQFDPFQFAGQIDTGNISLNSLQKAKYQNGTYSVQAISLINFNGAGLYSSTDLAAWTSQTLPVGNFSTKFGTQVQPINTLVEIQTAIGDQNNDTAEILAPVDVYTVPINIATTIDQITLKNNSANQITYDLGVLAAGVNLTDGNALINDQAIAAGETVTVSNITGKKLPGTRVSVLPSAVDVVEVKVYGTTSPAARIINSAASVFNTGTIQGYSVSVNSNDMFVINESVIYKGITYEVINKGQTPFPSIGLAAIDQNNPAPSPFIDGEYIVPE